MSYVLKLWNGEHYSYDYYYYYCCYIYVVSQHESSSLDDKLVWLFISDHSGGETCSAGRFPAGVHGTWAELLHVPDPKTNHSQNELERAELK